MFHSASSGWRAALGGASVAALVLLSGCAYHRASPEPQDVAKLYFYAPAKQKNDKQDRDRYECFRWAREQTRFDPSRPSLSVAQRLEVVAVSAPPGATAKPASPAKTRTSRGNAAANEFRRAITACLEGRGYVVY